ncbi:MAG: 1,4-alpha-glucan branching protein GlgB [Rhodothermales bacterium]|nr:1,4-alpha-glucan branching protein GlgB [Rhodothermales bacterium]MBO6780963.1 1,4-alpha-glucan branching protein GlgB [Rhodothermales bacterium]
MPWLTSEDISRWERGIHFDCYRKLGAHPNRVGTWFAVWAPSAESIAVIGDFNGWDPSANPLNPVGGGLWEGYIRGAKTGQHYKYRVRRGDFVVDKTDPYARSLEAPAPNGNALVGMSSIIASSDYAWGDSSWMASRRGPETMHEPVSIYEVHLGSWKRGPDGNSLSYREVAEPLADHLEDMGFTHVELMPVQEHPYYPSWGYQVVGYYAPTYRYGTADDFRYLVDYLHQRGFGVILDWVPAHFATDPQGLAYFDGSALYEHWDPVMRHHPDWGTLVFDYGKAGVRNFLIANACYWLDEFHIDGLRFDAVASMLYRDYSRDNWTPNQFGGRENLEAIDFLKRTNEEVYSRFPSVMMIAEESTAWPGVSAPTYDGGLGFLYKWNMGWMHDTLEFMRQDPINRKYHFNSLTFPLVYAYSEHYALTLSHDEVVHGKGSLWNKMPGDSWQQAANLRLMYAHMWGHPGKKLLFMGSEFGQVREWSHDREIDWFLAQDSLHAGVRDFLRELNALYKAEPALANEEGGGFEWIDLSDWERCVVSYRRKPRTPAPEPEPEKGRKKKRKKKERPVPELAFVLNFTPMPRSDYGVHLPEGEWELVLNSDDVRFGGSGVSPGTVVVSKVHGTTSVEVAAVQDANAGQEAAVASDAPVAAEKPYALLTLPPLGALILRQKV